MNVEIAEQNLLGSGHTDVPGSAMKRGRSLRRNGGVDGPGRWLAAQGRVDEAALAQDVEHEKSQDDEDGDTAEYASDHGGSSLVGFYHCPVAEESPGAGTASRM